jgi:peptide chain release factor subunit 1
MAIAAILCMTNASPAAESALLEQFQTLAAYEPAGGQVVSLYLSLTPDQHGRDDYAAFCRRVFADALNAAAEESGEQGALAAVFERIQAYLSEHIMPSANGLAIFAATEDGGLFEAMQLVAPIDEHAFYIAPTPHLFPLARLIDQNPRYAAVFLDSNRARIIVFGLGAVEAREDVTGTKTRRHSMGGWSQARYQRHIDNVHQQHVKEVASALDEIVRAERIEHVIVAGDDSITARLREEMSAPLAEKLVDVLRLDRFAPEQEIVAQALEALRRKDAEDDAERAAGVLGAWRGGGLGVAGVPATRRALQQGQVSELLIAAETNDAKRADELVRLAAQTGAAVRMIEDPELLREHGGVAGALRFRIGKAPAS